MTSVVKERKRSHRHFIVAHPTYTKTMDGESPAWLEGGDAKKATATAAAPSFLMSEDDDAPTASAAARAGLDNALSPPSILQMKSFPIATKNYDGGSSEEANKSKRRSVFIEVGHDAFSLYSNNEVRMDRLLSRRASAPPIPSNTGNMDTSATKKTRDTSIPSYRPPRRVTRLSFEVHPSLVLDPILLSDVGGMDDSSPTNVSDSSPSNVSSTAK
jgi:hypothetical protein